MYRSDQEMLARSRARGLEIRQRRHRRRMVGIGVGMCVVALLITATIVSSQHDPGSTTIVAAMADATAVPGSTDGVAPTVSTAPLGTTAQATPPSSDVATPGPEYSTLRPVTAPPMRTATSTTAAPSTTLAPASTTRSAPPTEASTTTASTPEPPACTTGDLAYAVALDTPTVHVGDHVTVTATWTNISDRPCTYGPGGIFGYTITDAANKTLYSTSLGVASAIQRLVPGDKTSWAYDWDQTCSDGACPPTDHAPLGTYTITLFGGHPTYNFSIT